jgi:hypothetical protein
MFDGAAIAFWGNTITERSLKNILEDLDEVLRQSG